VCNPLAFSIKPYQGEAMDKALHSPSARGVIQQFGEIEDGLEYPVRPCAYGLLFDTGGNVALVKIGEGEPYEFDLPGGGVDGDETEEQAVVREFAEETGLAVVPGKFVTRAIQYWSRKRTRPRHANSAFYRVRLTGPAEGPREPDHDLVWMRPDRAIACLRHEAHAWALSVALREEVSADVEPL
jgi:8-oxo-dGTP diphosphatase